MKGCNTNGRGVVISAASEVTATVVTAEEFQNGVMH
jgi:hypothetical protein